MPLSVCRCLCKLSPVIVPAGAWGAPPRAPFFWSSHSTVRFPRLSPDAVGGQREIQPPVSLTWLTECFWTGLLLSSLHLSHVTPLSPIPSSPYLLAKMHQDLALLRSPNCRQGLPPRPSWCGPACFSSFTHAQLKSQHTLLPVAYISHICLLTGLSQEGPLPWTHSSPLPFHPWAFKLLILWGSA